MYHDFQPKKQQFLPSLQCLIIINQVITRTWTLTMGSQLSPGPLLWVQEPQIIHMCFFAAIVPAKNKKVSI